MADSLSAHAADSEIVTQPHVRTRVTRQRVTRLASKQRVAALAPHLVAGVATGPDIERAHHAVVAIADRILAFGAFACRAAFAVLGVVIAVEGAELFRSLVRMRTLVGVLPETYRKR